MPFQRGTDMPEDIDMAVRHTGWPGNLPPADGEQNGKEVVRQQAGIKAMQADIAFRVRGTVEGFLKTVSSMIAYGDNKRISPWSPGGMQDKRYNFPELGDGLCVGGLVCIDGIPQAIPWPAEMCSAEVENMKAG